MAPWATDSQTEDEAEGLARAFRGKYLLNTDFVIGAWTPDEGRLLGGTGFHLRPHELSAGIAEIGMWVRADAAGQGVGTSMLRAMLEWGFTEWPWERLSWHCDSRNIASRRVAEKAGMRLEGTFRGDISDTDPTQRRDTLVFGLTRADFEG